MNDKISVLMFPHKIHVVFSFWFDVKEVLEEKHCKQIDPVVQTLYRIVNVIYENLLRTFNN